MFKKTISIFAVTILFFSLDTIVCAQSTQVNKERKLIPAKDFIIADIGNPALAGTVKISDDGFDITAGGADIWGTKDEFTFVYVENSGDFDLVSRIESLTASNLYTKAGLMAREDLSANCRHIYFQVFPNNNPRNKNNGGCEYQYRQERGGEMKAIYPKSSEGTPEFPVSFPDTWIRLKRVNNDFTGFYSTDGKNWKVYTIYTLDLPYKIYLGLAVTSHNTAGTSTAKFRKISEIKH